LGAASASCCPLTRLLVCPDIRLSPGRCSAWLARVRMSQLTRSHRDRTCYVQSPRDWRKIAQVRNDPKRGARLQGAAPASTNRGVTRTDPAESRQAPIAERERRPLQAPALRTRSCNAAPSGHGRSGSTVRCAAFEATMLLVASTGALSFCILPAGGGPTRVTATRNMQERCRSSERHVLLAPAASNRRAARSGRSPVSNARAGYASRRPRPRWTAERFPVLSNWGMEL